MSSIILNISKGDYNLGLFQAEDLAKNQVIS